MTGGAAAPARHTFTVGAAEDAAVRLDVLVATRCALSRTQAATLIADGQVRVDGAVARASVKPPAGATVTVEIPPAPGRAVVPEAIPLAVVHEDDALLVVDKPAGMVVHPAPGHWSGTLVHALLGRGGALAEGAAPERAGLVHRLDKDTSGLLLVAKTDRAHRQLAADLAARRIQRRYAALCWGHLDTDRVTVDRPLARDPHDRRRVAVVDGGRAARTDFVRLARFASCDLLRCHLHTGRTHQIRVHLAAIGHPVVGDDTYGGGGGRALVGLRPGRHFLHAAWLRFRHPGTGAVLDLRSPLPADLVAVLARAAGDPDLVEHPDPLSYLGFHGSDVGA
jgi:23S rRNA pseudouridine1911/1915/1917 synthase